MQIPDKLALHVAAAAPGEVRMAANHAPVGNTKVLVLIANEPGVVALTDAMSMAAQKYRADGDMERFNGLKESVEQIAAAFGVRSS